MSICLACCETFDTITIHYSDGEEDSNYCEECLTYMKDIQYTAKIDTLKNANCLKQFKNALSSPITSDFFVDHRKVTDLTINDIKVQYVVLVPFSDEELKNINDKMAFIYNEIKDMKDDTPVTINDYDYMNETKLFIEEWNL